ncbi:MAG: HigA family addiction module antidote protein [Nitrospirae bacterium]|nr:HigA family addiction module antidote protein [Nitrospirota bacterium]
MINSKLNPVHPGEVLLEEFLKPMGLSQNKLALNIGVPARRINEIVLEKRRVTADELGERLEKEVRIYSEVA